MGAVFRHEDLLKGRRKLLEEGIRDLSPQMRENIFTILQSWDGADSEERLRAIVGEEKTKQIREKLRQ